MSFVDKHTLGSPQSTNLTNIDPQNLFYCGYLALYPCKYNLRFRLIQFLAANLLKLEAKYVSVDYNKKRVDILFYVNSFFPD